MHEVLCRTINGQVAAILRPHRVGFSQDTEGIAIIFNFNGNIRDRQVFKIIADAVDQSEGFFWMTHHPDGRWEIDLDSLRMKMPRLLGPDDEWATGVATILPELHREYGVKQTGGGSLNIGDLNFNKLSKVTSQVATTVSFCVYKDEFMEQKARRIFLSHKGTDKQEHAVPIFDLLELLGFEPWLDTKDMPAGTELHRGIREGFSDSCAAVFFITPAFTDEKYLKQEINYAIEEKTNKGNRFAIITLVYADKNRKTPEIPVLLKSYVWKPVENNLQALKEILQALPIKLGPIEWDGC